MSLASSPLTTIVIDLNVLATVTPFVAISYFLFDRGANDNRRVNGEWSSVTIGCRSYSATPAATNGGRAPTPSRRLLLLL